MGEMGHETHYKAKLLRIILSETCNNHTTDKPQNRLKDMPRPIYPVLFHSNSVTPSPNFSQQGSINQFVLTMIYIVTSITVQCYNM